MKATLGIIAVLLLIAAIAASVWHRQRVSEATAQQESSALRSQMQTLETELAEAHAREQQQRSVPIVPSQTNRVSATANISTPSLATNGAPSPAMLNDPETRALLRKQQQQQVTKAIDKLVSTNFARELNLSPEQTTRVKELLRNRVLAGADFTTAMLFDGLDDNALAQRGRETKQKIDESETALRELLGMDGFNALKEHEQSMPERDGVKEFRKELESSDAPLNAEQEKSLLAAMGAERQAFSFRIDYSDPAKYDYEHIRDFFSEANLQTYFEDLQQVNARIAERATLFLSPTQLEQLKNAQNEHLEKARLTVKMTTELFNKRRPN